MKMLKKPKINLENNLCMSLRNPKDVPNSQSIQQQIETKT